MIVSKRLVPKGKDEQVEEEPGKHFIYKIVKKNYYYLGDELIVKK